MLFHYPASVKEFRISQSRKFTAAYFRFASIELPIENNRNYPASTPTDTLIDQKSASAYIKMLRKKKYL